MAQTHAEVATLVKTIVCGLVDDQESIRVEYYEDGDDVRIEVTVHPDETGKVIGRQGRIIKSIRTLARAAASQSGFDAEVEVLG